MNDLEFSNLMLLEIEIQTTENFIKSLNEIATDPNEKRANKARARWRLKDAKKELAILQKRHTTIVLKDAQS